VDERQKARLARKGVKETIERWRDDIIKVIEDEEVTTWAQFAQRLGPYAHTKYEPLCHVMVTVSGHSDARRCFGCVLMVDDALVCHPEWVAFNKTAEKIKHGWDWTPRRNWRRHQSELLSHAQAFLAAQVAAMPPICKKCHEPILGAKGRTGNHSYHLNHYVASGAESK
jgi:hypothetical protein